MRFVPLFLMILILCGGASSLAPEAPVPRDWMVELVAPLAAPAPPR